MTSVAHYPTHDEKPFGAAELEDGHSIPPNYSEEMLPDYDDNGVSSMSAGFHATRQLQIEARGEHGSGSSYFSKQPTYIYEVSPDGRHSGGYVSVRPKRGSNSCYLVRAGDASETPLANTSYRIGPFRPPRIGIQGLGADVAVHSSKWGCLSRETSMETPFGVFRWRYGSRRERHAVDATSLIIMDWKTDGEGSVEGWRCVAQLIRNKDLRSAGSTRWSVGNGGRLLLDLRPWAEAKGALQHIEVLCMSSCLVMLKREIDNGQVVVAPAPVVS
ncbi:hypothetical protein B0I35DRAFT_434369 [Stachybotrys elegans]|uniref:Uncharacterized protein n=1 Tax=Stachybotrys elegans TaxID=80388 RepID=A0A8K0WQN1_9HYPO|nr:hypothetical protein B0I35DRAFT_434369 [Stachybotrys elegans]